MSFLDPVLGWTLLFHPFVGIFILSLIITLIINLIYKYTTDQKEMKRLKEQIDDYRKKIKASRDNPKKMMKLNNEAMEVNMKYMGKSLKPTLYTFIPIIFIFAWMNANYTYAPMEQGDPLIIEAHFREGISGTAILTSETLTTRNLSATIQPADGDNLASFPVTGSGGEHNFSVQYVGLDVLTNGTVWFGEKPAVQEFEGLGVVESVQVDYPRIKPLGPISIFGWRPGWLAIYIVLSIVLSMSLRKLMKIY